MNEAPFDLTIEGGSVAENAPVGTVVVTASASDPDAGDTLTYSLADDAGGRFAIDPVTGEITTTVELDHESAGSHTVRVVATDSGGLTSEADLAITVGDVNEAPAFAETGDVSLSAEQGEQVQVDVGASDPEGRPLTYAWRQIEGPPVQLADPQASAVQFVAPNLEADTELVFVVEVSDGEHTSDRVVRVFIAAGDAGYDLESGEPTEEGAADAEQTQAERRAGAPGLAEESRSGANAPAGGDSVEQADSAMFFQAPEAVEVERAEVSAADPIEWLVSEIREISEIARSVEPEDLEFDSDHRRADAEMTFEQVFEDAAFTGVNADPETQAVEEGAATASNSFLLKMLTLLRAGFGVQSRDDETDPNTTDRFKR